MKFYSTKNKSCSVSLKKAVLSGMPSDGGLYMPEFIPVLNDTEIHRMEVESIPEIAMTVLKDYVSEDINITELEEIVWEALNFQFPVKAIDENKAVLELFHGPTLAFKDVGARFMSRLMSKLIRNEKQGQNIIVATSGDTGSAVASGFYNVEGVQVFILFPSGKISTLQQKQMTTLGKNIKPIEVKGTFDDCQKIVKKALNDEYINEKHRVTTANSINVARLLPQAVYYFKAYHESKKLNPTKKEIVFCVPSGNFGNLCAGLLAKKMGLHIAHFLAATNVNDSVPEYLRTGHFQSKSSVQTISNAMDVGNPSNFERILDLYDNDLKRIKHDISGYSFNDKHTLDMMKKTFNDRGYILDPHGAVGLLALAEYLKKNDENFFGISLETAHPSKFRETVEAVIKQELEIPQRLLNRIKLKESSIKANNNYQETKTILLDQMI